MNLLLVTCKMYTLPRESTTAMESPQGAKATLVRTKFVFFPPVLPPLRKTKLEMLPLLVMAGLARQILPNLPDITIGLALD